jgi:NAD(P)-dependent dehydrogenase (short-subunit alcohol dehydrogenase family)
MMPEPLTIRDNYKSSKKLQGKVALITGGDSGIGRAVAVHFAREWADVAIVYLEENEDALETQRLVRAEGQDCILIQADVSQPESCQKVVQEVQEYFGQLDILVNNAAEQHPQQSLLEITPEQLEKTFRTNIFGYFYMTQAALPLLKEGSSIINTGSVTSFRGSSHLIDYAATKGAIQSFTFSLATSLAERGIRVNAVAPGPIWTPLIPASFPAEAMPDFGSDTLMKRAGQPAELGPAYVLLAGEDGSYITGQFIHINGGGFIAP